jgi:hypothetical protein
LRTRAANKLLFELWHGVGAVGDGGFGAKGCGDDDHLGDLLLRRFSSAPFLPWMSMQ